jgi:hypothetical protein
MSNPNQTVPRALKHIWTPIVKNGAGVATLVNSTGGVVHGMIVQNMTGVALCFGLFNKTALSGLANSDMVASFPLPASSAIVILPEEFGLLEFNAGVIWGVYASADPTTPVGNFTAGANSASVQLAMA